MPKPLILFDIDKTLIDTDRLRALLKQNLAQLLGRSEDEVADAFLEYGSNLPDNTAFHPEELLKLFSQRFHIVSITYAIENSVSIPISPRTINLCFELCYTDTMFFGIFGGGSLDIRFV